MTRRLEYGRDLTKNEAACLRVLREAGDGMAVTTVQVASQAGIGSSSATVALTRLLDRGLVRRIERAAAGEPIRWLAADVRVPRSAA